MSKSVTQKSDIKISDSNFTRMILPSVFGALICMALMLSTTWAWFTDSKTPAETTLRAAGYDFEKSVINQEQPLVPDGEGVYSMSAGETYSVTLTQTGEATTGYCKISVSKGGGAVAYYSAQIPVGTVFSFDIEAISDCTVLFDAHWGTYSGTPDISSGGLLTID